VQTLGPTKTRSDKEKKKQVEDSPTSSKLATSDPKIKDMNNTLKDLTFEIAKLKWESKHPNINFQGVGNRNQNQFRRPNDAPQVMQRERRNVDDQKVVPPFQNNHIEDIDADNDVVDDTTRIFNETDYYTSHLTQQEYEVAQMSSQFDDQIGEEGPFKGQPKKKYDLRMRNGTSNTTTFDQRKQVESPPKPNPRYVI
jgi:hypothetical protein